MARPKRTGLEKQIARQRKVVNERNRRARLSSSYREQNRNRMRMQRLSQRPNSSTPRTYRNTTIVAQQDQSSHATANNDSDATIIYDSDATEIYETDDQQDEPGFINNVPTRRVKRTHRIAFNSPINTSEHYLGKMTEKCPLLCGALFFKSEKSLKCCYGGKLLGIPLPQSTPTIQNLLTGNDENSKNFRERIRSYNSSFAMISTNAKLHPNVGHGPYMYKIHDSIYHSLGTLHPQANETEQYAQVYIFDVNRANRKRMENPANSSCTLDVLDTIANHLEQVNPHVQIYRTIRE